MALRACRECGQQVSSDAKVCPHCGRKQATSTAVVGFLALIVLLIVLGIVGSLDREPVQSLAPRPMTKAGQEAPAKAAAEVAAVRPKHAVGEEFSVGYWSYRCNGARWLPFIGSGFGSIERPDAEFLVLDLYVRNDDRTSSTLPPLKLIDPQGREFDESSKGTFLEGSFGALKQLNPGVSSRGLVVFDVPPGEYMLKVSGGFESGQDALVDLSSGRRQEAGQEPSQTTPAPAPVPPEVAAKIGELENQSAQNPQDPAPRLKLANLYYDQRQFDRAAEWYEKELALDPQNVNAHTDLGTAYFNMGRPQDALREYEAALKIDPTNEPTMFNIIIANLQGTRDVAAARAAWKKLHERNSKYPGLDKVKESLDAAGGKN